MTDKLRAYFQLQPTAHLLCDPEQNHLAWLSYFSAFKNMGMIFLSAAHLTEMSLAEGRSSVKSSARTQREGSELIQGFITRRANSSELPSSKDVQGLLTFVGH